MAMVAAAAPLAPIPVPIMKPYLLPTRFIKSDAGIPASMVPSKWNESGKVANALLSAIPKPTSDDADTVMLLVDPEKAKHTLKRNMVLIKFDSEFCIPYS